MSEQADAANAVARAIGGGMVDPNSTGTAAPATNKKPEPIKVRLPSEGYQLSLTAKELGAIVRTNGVFKRDAVFVTIGRDDRGRPMFEELCAQRFRTYVEKLCVTGKWRNGGEDGPPVFKAMTMSAEVSAGVLKTDAFKEQQRPVRRINEVPFPVMRGDGRIELLAPGYDEETRIFTVESGVKVREDWTLEQSIAFFRALYKEFPLAERKDDGTCRSEAVIIAALLSLWGIDLLGPLTSRLHFFVTANSQRSGKSLIAKSIIAPVCGIPHARTKPESSEEMRKELAAAALGGRPYFFMDDLDGLLKSQELNAFMTSAGVGGRMLGGLSEFSAEKQCVVFITGNNLSLSPDIENRTLRCSLYEEQFDMHARQVSRTIDEEWLLRPDTRSDILSALWAIIKSWDKAGRPEGKRVLKGFERWCRMFGGMVMHAGFGDPCEQPPADDTSGDSDSADMKALVEVLVADMEKRPGSLDLNAPWTPPTKKTFEFQDLVDACLENSCFEWHMDGAWKEDKKTGEKWLELNQRSKSWLGKHWSGSAGGRIFRLKDGRMVRFGAKGKNRQKRYVVNFNLKEKDV